MGRVARRDLHAGNCTVGWFEPLPAGTEESWCWWAECWKVIFEAAGVHPGDRIYFAFSFGPFIGFWAGWEGARKLGAMAVSGGGQSTSQRLKAIIDYGATVLVCTPTYALHMASEARKAGMDLAKESSHKDHHPCWRARGEYSEHKEDDRTVLGSEML